MAHESDHEFDKDYWDRHWQSGQNGRPAMDAAPPNPHLIRETADLVPSTALDAGCGAGNEAIWLASGGWQVTGVDVSADALAFAAERAQAHGVSEQTHWVEADMTVWEPGTQFGLVTTHYAHPAIPQLEFYDRLASWVAPGGTLLIVGHLHTHDHDAPHDDASEHTPPAKASVTAESVAALLDPALWQIATATETSRTIAAHGGEEIPLHDVVVRAVRRSA